MNRNLFLCTFSSFLFQVSIFIKQHLPQNLPNNKECESSHLVGEYFKKFFQCARKLRRLGFPENYINKGLFTNHPTRE